jgi:hypothetical protein
MVAHVAAASGCADDSLNTLRYAEQLRAAFSRKPADPPPAAAAAAVAANAAAAAAAAAASRQQASARPLTPQPAPARAPTPPHAPPAAVASATEQPAIESAAPSLPPPSLPPPSLPPPSLPPPSQPAGEQHQRTLEVLQDVLRCCHDPAAWQKEEAALLQLAGSLEGTQQYADHLDKVLTDRADMFLKMRDGLRVLREKARATAAPQPNSRAAVLLD